MSASKVSESHQDLRLARQLGRDFDDERLVRAGDDELVLRAAAAALARPRARRHGRRPALLLAAALLLALGTAAAAASVWVAGRAAPRARTAEAAPPTSRLPREHAGGAPLGHAAPSLEPRASASETLEPYAAVEATNAAHAPPTGRRSSSAPAPSARTAASLFQEASAARRAGDLRSARASYLELQASFADSNEARVSHVSLGKLLLGAGHAGEAERQFREYLGQGGGDLRAEALVGRAEALGALGQSAEERRAWQEILQQHPSSVYAPRARLRLGELGAAD